MSWFYRNLWDKLMIHRLINHRCLYEPNQTHRMFLVHTLSLTRCRLFKYCIAHAPAVWEAIASSVQLKGKNHGYKQASSCPLGTIFPSRHRSCLTRRGEKCPFSGFHDTPEAQLIRTGVVDLRAMCRSWLLDGCADRLLTARRGYQQRILQRIQTCRALRKPDTYVETYQIFFLMFFGTWLPSVMIRLVRLSRMI